MLPDLIVEINELFVIDHDPGLYIVRIKPSVYAFAPMSEIAVRLFSHSIKWHVLIAELAVKILTVTGPQLSDSAPLSLPCSRQHNYSVGLLHDILDYID